jgi:photosynthetic reaction center cytochrome c subunit/tetratricopeptide repeat protein
MSRRIMIRNLAGALAVSLLTSIANAQLPQKPENLQVLPRDMPTDSVVAIMRGFALSLGVRCTFCHVEREQPAGAPAPGPGGGGGGGGPFQNFNFKSDEKDHKKIARVMLRMVDSINTRFLASIPNRDDPPTNVNCMTCHRGLSKPTTIQTVLLNTTARGGVDSAITRYRALRSDMAFGRYDFSEQPVADVAQRLVMQKRYDDAIKLLQMNQEFYPSSANLEFQLADTYIAKGDTTQGVTRLRAVLTKNPNDRRAQGRLRQLGVQP